MRTIALALALVVSVAVSAYAQKPKPTDASPSATPADNSHVRSSAAFAEVLLRQNELRAALDSLLEEYTDSHPKVIETRLQLSCIESDLRRIEAVGPESAGKLTAALGRLIVRKSELYSEFQITQKQYDSENPKARRAKKAYESFSKSIDDILR